jgi:UDP-2-acetamido-3-amino-2,3-dideoxy-glucuronate N-acetyltransferase
MNLALIGAGRWGKNYLKAVKNIPEAKIRYVCSGRDSLGNLSKEYIKVENYRDLVKIKDIDGVIVAVPASKHFELVKFFIEANLPILIEKPLVTSIDQAEELKKIFEKMSGKILVGNIFLYNQAFQKLAELTGEMKNIQYLNFESCDFGPIRQDISALWDWGPHDVSMCLALLERRPISVSAWAVNVVRPNTNLYDMVYARLLFESNISVFLKMGWLSPVKKREILVVGNNESFLLNDLSDKKITRFDNLQRSTNINYSFSEPLVNELNDFIEMIKNNKIPSSDFNKSFAVITVLDALEKSIKKNGITIKIEK